MKQHICTCPKRGRREKGGTKEVERREGGGWERGGRVGGGREGEGGGRREEGEGGRGGVKRNTVKAEME